MEENSKHTAKMKDNLHPNLEEASGMAPKLRMFEELRKMEHERRTRVEMERKQQEENERGERRRQREILEDEWKKQIWEEDRIRQEERSIEVAEQALEREHLEREKLEEKEVDVDEVCLRYENNLPETSQNTQSQAKRVERKEAQKIKEEEGYESWAARKREWLNQNIADDKHFTGDRVMTSGHTGEVEEDADEVCLNLCLNLPETSQNTHSKSLLSAVEIPERATEETLADNKKDLNFLNNYKAFNWLKKRVKKRTLPKIEQTYQREAKEGSEPYLLLVRSMASMRDSPLPYTRADRERAKLMVTEKQRQKIEDRWNRNQAKHAAGERGLSTIEELSEVVEKCLEQLSHTGEAEEDGDTLQDEEEDVEEVCLMFGQNLPETSQDTQSESLLSAVEIPEEATEEPLANNKKDLNFQQKAFNWLNKKVKKRTLPKKLRTYQREAEEGSEPYLPLVRCMASMRDSPLPTRADRERAKREKLMVFCCPYSAVHSHSPFCCP